jgi:hypothetical protein
MSLEQEYQAKDRGEIIESFKQERDSVEVLILELNQKAIKTASKYAKKGGATKEELSEQKNLRYQISELEKSQKSRHRHGCTKANAFKIQRRKANS